MAGQQQHDTSKIDVAIQDWRQGDLILENVPFFVHLADLSAPLTSESSEAATVEQFTEDDSLAGISSQARGLVIVTQTCDVIRVSQDRPYVELSPLIEVSPTELESIRRLRHPRYAYVPGAAELCMVADLDQTMTVEKAVLANLARVPGCRNDQERRAFADALARKRSRFAFPNDFTSAVRSVRRRLQAKNDKITPEGILIRALQEIRVRAAPGWDENNIRLTFLFILSDDQPTPTQNDEVQIKVLLERFDQTGRFVLDQTMPWRLCFLQDIDAREYLESDRLDLDDISPS